MNSHKMDKHERIIYWTERFHKSRAKIFQSYADLITFLICTAIVCIGLALIAMFALVPPMTLAQILGLCKGTAYRDTHHGYHFDHPTRHTTPGMVPTEIHEVTPETEYPDYISVITEGDIETVPWLTPEVVEETPETPETSETWGEEEMKTTIKQVDHATKSTTYGKVTRTTHFGTTFGKSTVKHVTVQISTHHYPLLTVAKSTPSKTISLTTETTEIPTTPTRTTGVTTTVTKKTLATKTTTTTTTPRTKKTTTRRTTTTRKRRRTKTSTTTTTASTISEIPTTKRIWTSTMRLTTTRKPRKTKTSTTTTTEPTTIEIKTPKHTSTTSRRTTTTRRTRKTKTTIATTTTTELPTTRRTTTTMTRRTTTRKLKKLKTTTPTTTTEERTTTKKKPTTTQLRRGTTTRRTRKTTTTTTTEAPTTTEPTPKPTWAPPVFTHRTYPTPPTITIITTKRPFPLKTTSAAPTFSIPTVNMSEIGCYDYLEHYGPAHGTGYGHKHNFSYYGREGLVPGAHYHKDGSFHNHPHDLSKMPLREGDAKKGQLKTQIKGNYDPYQAYKNTEEVDDFFALQRHDKSHSMYDKSSRVIEIANVTKGKQSAGLRSDVADVKVQDIDVYYRPPYRNDHGISVKKKLSGYPTVESVSEKATTYIPSDNSRTVPLDFFPNPSRDASTVSESSHLEDVTNNLDQKTGPDQENDPALSDQLPNRDSSQLRQLPSDHHDYGNRNTPDSEGIYHRPPYRNDPAKSESPLKAKSFRRKANAMSLDFFPEDFNAASNDIGNKQVLGDENIKITDVELSGKAIDLAHEIPKPNYRSRPSMNREPETLDNEGIYHRPPYRMDSVSKTEHSKPPKSFATVRTKDIALAILPEESNVLPNDIESFTEDDSVSDVQEKMKKFEKNIALGEPQLTLDGAQPDQPRDREAIAGAEDVYSRSHYRSDSGLQSAVERPPLTAQEGNEALDHVSQAPPDDWLTVPNTDTQVYHPPPPDYD